MTHVQPAWMWVLLALWMPWNFRELRHEKRAKLAADDEAYTFVAGIMRWGVKHPQVDTLIYDGVPVNFHLKKKWWWGGGGKVVFWWCSREEEEEAC